MKKKISKFIFLFILPAIALSMVSVLFATNFISSYVRAEDKFGGAFRVVGKSTISIGGETSLSNFSAKDGGAVWVDTNATFNMTGGTISNNTADGNGGAVYNTGTFTMSNGTISENTATTNGGAVCNTGTFTMSGGTISENTITSTTGNGYNIYNAGTFTMNGGTVGTSESTQTGYGIYNTGTMTLSGGTVYDDIYSSTSFTTTPNVNLNGTITLGDDATITVTNYNGTTPNYTINLSSSRANGTILTFNGNTTAPNMNNLTITGYSNVKSKLTCVQGSSSTEWVVKLIPQQYTLTLSAGTGVSSVSGAGTYDYGTNVTISISSRYAGYNGGYWKENGTTISTSSSTTVTITSNRTLTAYAYRNTYYVRYNGNGNTNTTTMSNSTHTYGISSTLSENLYNKTGCNFTGWNTKADGSGNSYSNKQSVAYLTTTNGGIVDLYAQWEKNTYTITFDQNGGTGGTYSKSVCYGDSLPNIDLPTRSGYKFDGYYFGTELYYSSSGTHSLTFEFTEDITLIASWQKIEKDFVRVNDNGIEDENGGYVLFGSYPQSKASTSVKLALDLGNALSTADGYYFYNGSTYIKYGGEYYCVEPVKWKIVRESKSTGLMTLVSESILDASIFNNISSTVYYDNCYTNSSNDTNSVLADKVETGLSYNNDGYIFGSYGGHLLYGIDNNSWNVSLYNMLYSMSNTANCYQYTYYSKIRVPSYEECYDSITGNNVSSVYPDSYSDYAYYGFDTVKTATAYAKAMGCSNDSWWTMTGTAPSNSLFAWYVNNTGGLNNASNGGDGYANIEDVRGVVPLINISTEFLMSCGHIWDYAENGDIYESSSEVVFDSDGCYIQYTKTCLNSLCPNHNKETSSEIVIIENSHKSHDDSCIISTGPWNKDEEGIKHYRTISYSCSQCGKSWTKPEIGTHSWSLSYTISDYTWDEYDSGYHYQYKYTPCTDCGYVKKEQINKEKHSMYSTTGSPVDYCPTKHSITTTWRCQNLNCDYTRSDGTRYESHSFDTELSRTNEASSDNSEHIVIKTMQCSCSRTTTESETHTLTKKTYYESIDSTYHRLYTNYTCSESCGYTTDPVAGLKSKHDTIGAGGSCSVCHYGILMFLPSGEHLECDNCVEHENVLNCQSLVSSLTKSSVSTFEADLWDEQEIIFDDKKKSGTLVIDKKTLKF